MPLTCTRCINRVPQLPAHNLGIIVIPGMATHCHPFSTSTDLHFACTAHRSANKMESSICANLCNNYNQRETLSVVALPHALIYR